MRILSLLAIVFGSLSSLACSEDVQVPLLLDNRAVPVSLSAELEELARIVDIAYCVTIAGLGISKPFTCLSRCSEFPSFELVGTWNTGPLFSDSCGYIALDHAKSRIIVAFRGTYSLTNTIIDLSTIPQTYEPYPGSPGDDAWPSSSMPNNATCTNCTVHMGFHTSWTNTRRVIEPMLQPLRDNHTNYTLHLVGHSLGGAIATLGALDFHAQGWKPITTTFGAPRVGNAALAQYIDSQFALRRPSPSLSFRRITHVDDPVPLLPPSEFLFASHAGEIYISKPALTPDTIDLQLCQGNADVHCSAGQDSTLMDEPDDEKRRAPSDDLGVSHYNPDPWPLPSRLKLWQLLFAHRDYFSRLGLCLPSAKSHG